VGAASARIEAALLVFGEAVKAIASASLTSGWHLVSLEAIKAAIAQQSSIP
jgi:hypothetical protein